MKGLPNVNFGFHRLVQHVDNFYTRIADAIIDMVFFSLNAVITYFDFATLPAFFRIFRVLSGDIFKQYRSERYI